MRSAPLLASSALAASALAAALLGAAVPAAALAPGRLHSCHAEGVPEEVRCGTLAVWEDRAARRGRKIDLNVVVLPALGPDAVPDPIFSFSGGPGEAATGDADFWAGQPAIRQRRDVVLVDQRGTGRSNPLDCDLHGPGSHTGGGPADLRQMAYDLYSPAAIRVCRERLEKHANLELYTTSIAMDDIDEVRAWLGYGKINLWGGSYGTRAAQFYLRRHPESVRTVTLQSVVPADETVPLHHAYAGQRALDLLLAECASDRACHGAFPRLREELAAVMERIDRGARVQLADPGAGGGVELTPSRGLIAEGIRYMMYGRRAREVPLVIHRAFQGDLAQLVALAIDRRAKIEESLAMGMYFSVTCAEDLPFIDAASAARATAGTLLGDYRIRQQKAVCALWPRGAVPPDVHELVRSGVPALILSGERDPVTPPEFGARVASRLPHAVHVVLPHASHAEAGPCSDKILADFLAAGAVERLDTSCAAANPPTRFELP